MSCWPNAKDPDDVADYQIDWSARLAGDVIVASDWIVPAGITAGAKTFTGTSAAIWLSGGSANANYVLTNRITTAGGRTLDRSVTLLVRDQ